MGTKNNPGAFDCHAKAEPDEPMFVLLARDKHAPTLVWLWAALRQLDGEDPDVVHEARRCAGHMMAWAHDHGRKSAGLGQATLAGVLELIRTINNSPVHEGSKNAMTDVEIVRRFLSETRFATAAELNTPATE